MPTIFQLVKKCRKKKKLKKVTLLSKSPQRRGMCEKVYTMSPKKPNSAVRKVVRIRIKKTKELISAYIPGEGHNLQQHSIVLVRGGRTNDLPGFKYKVIRGVLDCKFVLNRFQSRSKYGVPKPKV